MFVKFRFPCSKLPEFLSWEKRWGSFIKVRKRPVEDGYLPESCRERCSEPLLFTDIETLDIVPHEGNEPNDKRFIIDELCDLTGFYPIDRAHPTTDSFSFEKDIQPIFESILGKEWRSRLVKIFSEKLAYDGTHLEEVILTSAGETTREDVLKRSVKIIGALLTIISAG